MGVPVGEEYVRCIEAVVRPGQARPDLVRLIRRQEQETADAVAVKRLGMLSQPNRSGSALPIVRLVCHAPGVALIKSTLTSACICRRCCASAPK